MSYQMLMPIKYPDFLLKCQIQPISQDQWQIWNFIFEFKCTHPIGMIFDGIRFGLVFLTIKRFLPQCVLRPSLGYFVIFRPESNMQYIVILSFIFAKILASLNMFRQVWTSLEEIWLVFKNFDVRAHFTMQYNKKENRKCKF